MSYKNLSLLFLLFIPSLLCAQTKSSFFQNQIHFQFNNANKSSLNTPVKPFVIYDDDNRTEVQEITDDEIRQLAHATVGIIHRSLLIHHSDNSTVGILSRYYGRSMRLCESERFYNQPSAPTCTGFLVAPDLLATAGHCINAGGCSAKAIIFNYQMNEKNEAPYTTQKENIFYCKEVLSREESEEQDYALIRLDRAVTNISPLSLATTPPEVGDSTFTIGHPSGLPKKISAGATVLETKKNFFKTNTDSYGGSSGSPLFNQNNQVIGILVRGEDDYVDQPVSNGSPLTCKISRVCIENKCRGEDATNIAFITEALKTVSH